MADPLSGGVGGSSVRYNAETGVLSVDGQGSITIPAASSSRPGLMSSAEKAAIAALPVNSIVDADFVADQGQMVKDSAGTYRAIKTNYGAAVAPAVTDDSAAGYAVGSQWFDTTADDHYICLDATEGAAVWKKTTP